MKLSLLILLAVICTATVAQHDVFLRQPNTIPLYAQQTNVWCGAGSAQMMLEGYPGGIEHKYQQKYIWDTLQSMKKEGMWYCDPDGLQNVMRQLGGGNAWNICYYRNQPQPLMHFLAKWMTNRRFPFAVLVYGHQHWVVIVGLSTNVDPNSSNNIMLNRIEIHDPWQAQHSLISGGTWYQRYWNEAGNNPSSKWHMCYVGVNETGSRAGETINVAQAETVTATATAELHQKSGEVLAVTQIMPLVFNVMQSVCGEHQQYAHLTSYQPLTPMLVNQSNLGYYLIPIGDTATQQSYGAIMLNAYTGAFEGVSAFGSPVRYVSEQEAVANTRGAEAKAIDWVFQPSEESRSPFHPACRITSGNRETVYVTCDGTTFSQFTSMKSGN